MRLILFAIIPLILTACSQSTAEKFRALKGKRLISDSTLKLDMLGQAIHSIKDDDGIDIVFKDSTIDNIDPYLGIDSNVRFYKFQPPRSVYTWRPSETLADAQLLKIEFSGSSIIITETIGEKTEKEYFHIK